MTSTRPSPSPPPLRCGQIATMRMQAAWTKLLDAWESIQVELHGYYSVERLQAFHDYKGRTTSTRTTLVMLLTPLPCLAAVAFADSIPLAPPELGFWHSSGYWIRTFFATGIYTVSILEQLRFFVPELPLTGYTTLAMAVPVMVISILIACAMSVAIGFPLPFSLVTASSPWVSLMGGALWFRLRSYFRAHPDALKKTLQFAMVFVCQLSLLLIYPAYNAVFYKLSATGQALFALLLPVIKLIEKNIISAVLRHADDLKPEMIIFNVEVFNALFVACCLQNSNSMVTNIMLVAVDFIMACVALRDLDLMLVDINALAEKLGIRKDQFIETALEISQLKGRRMESRVGHRILEERLHRQQFQSSSGFSRMWRTVATSSFVSRVSARLHPSRRIQPAPSSLEPTERHGKEPVPTTNAEDGAPVLGLREDGKVMPPWADDAPGDAELSAANQLRPGSIVALMDDNQRVLFLQKVLQTLHMTEYLLLVEYTEVMIPIVYSIYLIVLFHLPNRMYYPQLRQMDEEKLRQTIGNVMMNATLELISLVLLAIVLPKKFLSSPFRQLSFVLDGQWRMVQSKVVLWVVVTLQTTLDHVGSDYSFKFEWLHTSQTTTG